MDITGWLLQKTPNKKMYIQPENKENPEVWQLQICIMKKNPCNQQKSSHSKPETEHEGEAIYEKQ